MNDSVSKILSEYRFGSVIYFKQNLKDTAQTFQLTMDVQSYPDADAVLAVYGCKGSSLDPTEALVGGITQTKNACGPNLVAGMEAILGVVNPTGKLPVEIPVYENGRFTDEIRFPRGYGLSYS